MHSWEEVLQRMSDVNIAFRSLLTPLHLRHTKATILWGPCSSGRFHHVEMEEGLWRPGPTWQPGP